MEISGIVSAVVFGVVIGTMARSVLPGGQRLDVGWTIGVGVVAALIGTGIAAGLGVADTEGIDWIEYLLQMVSAAAGTAALSRVKARD